MFKDQKHHYRMKESIVSVIYVLQCSTRPNMVNMANQFSQSSYMTGVASFVDLKWHVLFLGFFQRWSLHTFTVRFLSTFNYLIFTGTITAFRPIIFPHTDVTGVHDSCLHQCSTSWAAQWRGGGGGKERKRWEGVSLVARRLPFNYQGV